MASRTIVHLEDDLDGGSADETLTFGIDDRVYEIDLCAANAATLRKNLARYIRAARVIGPVRRRGPVAAGARVALPADSAAIRAWAIAEGYEVSARGRVPASLRAAYEAR